MRFGTEVGGMILEFCIPKYDAVSGEGTHTARARISAGVVGGDFASASIREAFNIALTRGAS